MTGRYDSILGTVGNTPAVRINNLAPEGINLYVKIEAFNPMGSVKDRLALGIIEAAEARASFTSSYSSGVKTTINLFFPALSMSKSSESTGMTKRTRGWKAGTRGQNAPKTGG